MKRIKKFFENNQWTILAIIGALTWIALLAELYVGAMEVIGFYVTFALL